MSLDTLLILAALGVVILLLALLLLRRPPADPMLALLQAAQERQGERLGALGGDTRAALAAASEENGRVISGFAVEQTRQLVENQKALQSAIAGLTAQLVKLQTEAAETQRLGFVAAREAQADTAAILRRDLAGGIGEINTNFEKLRTGIVEAQAAAQQKLASELNTTRDLMEAKLKEMREGNDARLAEIQKSVNEQLAEAVEKKMTESFARVIDQFAALQKAMGDVQAVTTQIGDIKRLFGNVKTRGGWGETQVRSMLDDILPPNSYQQNVKLVEGSADAVEFCVVMPSSGETQVLLPIDSKFPTEDFERLQAAWEAADPVAEAQARRGLEVAIRTQSKKIAEKYINPPRTTEFAVLYLPTEGLYAEVARIPGLIDGIGRDHRIVVLGPTLLPAMLRTIQLGHVTLALSKNAESVKDLLGATKAEIGKMDALFASLAKQVGTVGTTIGRVQQRTRVIASKLRSVDALPGEEATALLGLSDGTIEGDED